MKSTWKLAPVVLAAVALGSWRSPGAEGSTSKLVADISPPDPIIDLTATFSATARAVTLSWTVPGDEVPPPTPNSISDGPVPPAGYDLRYSTSLILTDADFDAAVQIAGEPSGQQVGEIEAMVGVSLPSWGTIYYFAIKSYDSVNLSALSNPNPSGSTPPDVQPPEAIILSLTMSLTAAAATLTWNAPGDNAGAVSTYDLRYSTNPISPATWRSATAVVGEPSPPKTAGLPETTTFDLPNGGTTYYFAIQSVDGSGNGSPLSNVLSGTTFGVPPDAVIESGGGSGGGGCSGRVGGFTPSVQAILAALLVAGTALGLRR